MVGWDLPFEESMLSRGKVIILCPERDLAEELFEVLKAHGIGWYGGESMENIHWDSNEQDTCYRVTNTGSLMYGSTNCYEDSEYNDHIKCQFYGIESADSEISDSDFETIISAGGVDKGGKVHVG